MALIVQKYGGSSVGDLERIDHVADLIVKARQQGHQVVVVVSAMFGETDRLTQLAKHFNDVPDPREAAVLLATGEQVSMALLSMALMARGQPACSYSGAQIGLRTSDCYHKARILDIDISRITADLAADKVVVVAGFQGVNERDEITTLGRGGSDITAVALAAALKAKECQIFKDVEGVYTADPRIVPQARLLDQITYDEMVELTSLGAKVIQNRAAEFAGQYKVPLRVLSSFSEGPGTLIEFTQRSLEKPIVSGITYNRNEAKLTILGVPDRPGIASNIIKPISMADIAIDMIIQNAATDGTTDFTFTVHRDEYRHTLDLLHSIANELRARVVAGDDKIAKLSIVGGGMHSHSGIANTMFYTLGEAGINIQMISTSEIKVSVVVAENALEEGVRLLHSAFGLDHCANNRHDPDLR